MTSKILLKAKRNKAGHIYYQDINLVIKSAKEALVIGRLENDEFIPLDEKCLELCEQHNLKYDTTLVEEVPEENKTEPEETEQNEEPSEPIKQVVQPTQSITQSVTLPQAQPTPTPTSTPAQPLQATQSQQSNHSEKLTATLKQATALVAEMVEKANSEQSRLAEENAKLKKEVDTLKNKVKQLLAAISNEL